MKEYPKIQSIFKRDDKTHKFILGEYSMPEFEYLKDNVWVWSEKIDGTNSRIEWNSETVNFGGKTDNAQIPTPLLNRLRELFPADKLRSLYPETPMVLYGEGYGAGIQSGGKYNPKGVDFILFDIVIDDWWLKRESIEDIASKLGIAVVPVVDKGTLAQAINAIKLDLYSVFGNFSIEGLVLKTEIELKDRKGDRIITKAKGKDFL